MEMTKETTMMTAHALSNEIIQISCQGSTYYKMSHLFICLFDHNEKREVEFEIKRRNAQN